jgi:uncharacterized protein YyaL (SSP411 family)
MIHKHTNKLIGESSPYLLQHAHNPVNWFPWADEALQLAKEQNKPILVSIGYAACHWCHVMEKESFEDEATASLMNENFVCIKIDREERPDLDQIYMDALQTMNGQGGWPLNVFLTPDAKPFYGGTYFPPIPAHNRPSWKDVLIGVANAYENRREEILAQADSLTSHLAASNSFGINFKSDADAVFTASTLNTIAENLLKNADRQWGGFGRAPKFPQTNSILYLLRHYHETGNEEALAHAKLSLDKMMQGGIYDQLGGGFARYSTDSEWLAPHFEKMLYDNALLVSVYSEAYQLTNDKNYLQVIEKTIEFVCRELLDSSGGFYAALDADSEGVEGKFYVWSLQEIVSVLGDDANLFNEFYDVSDAGNWEHTNILWVKKPVEKFCSEKGLDVVEFEKILSSCRQKLMKSRDERVRPSLDDKILLGWNALMNAALSKAFGATGNVKFLDLAEKNMGFLLEKFSGSEDKKLFHSYKNGVARFSAVLEDYAYLIQALILLQEITGKTSYLDKAIDLTELVINEFSDEEHLYFYYTSAGQKDLIVRKKEVFDGAVPSGNAMMAKVLYHISIYTDNSVLKKRAMDMQKGLSQTITKHPNSFGSWACLLAEQTIGTSEIVVLGSEHKTLTNNILLQYIPYKVVMSASAETDNYPLLKGKKVQEKTAIFLCKNYTCLGPVFSIADFNEHLLAQKNL